MTVKFLNSESCEIDGKKLIFMRDPLAVFKKINETVQALGGEKFYSSTDIEVKRVRESMAGMFFSLTMKKLTGRDWYLMQPDDDPPDFYLISMSDTPPPIEMHGVELTEVPPRCKSYTEARDIISRKLKKYPPNKYSLLIFLNNSESTRWLPFLHKEFASQTIFKDIWTLHILGNADNTEFEEFWANRISPDPVRHSGVKIDDKDTWKFSDLPSFMHARESDGHTFTELNTEFIKAFRQQARGTK